MTPEEARAVADGFQWTNMFVSLLTVILALAAGHRWPKARPYLVAPITLAVHNVIFYFFALTDILVSPWGNLWSSALRLHSNATMLGMLLVFIIVAISPAPPEEDMEFMEGYNQQSWRVTVDHTYGPTPDKDAEPDDE